jgi:hypothetical protein
MATTPIHEILNMSNIKSKCIIRPAFGCRTDLVATGPDYVSSVLVSEDPEEIADYNRETNMDLILALRRIDPNMHRFVYAIKIHNGCTARTDIPSDVLSMCGISLQRQQAGLTYFNSPVLDSVFEPGKIPRSYLPYLQQSLRILHENGIIHGDAHGANIGVYHGRIVLFDFGKAQFTTSAELQRADMLLLENTFIPVVDRVPQRRQRSRSSDEDEDDESPRPKVRRVSSPTITKSLFE